jgi:hypothetical protein
MVTFQRPFILDGFPRDVPAGTYLVETEEELMDTVLSVAWRRASTVIRLRTATGTQDVFIDPEQLNAALLSDRAQQDAGAGGGGDGSSHSSVAAPTAPKAPSGPARNLIADRARKS